MVEPLKHCQLLGRQAWFSSEIRWLLNAWYTSRAPHLSVVLIAGTITNQSTSALGCAAILILNCLCLCLACSSSLSTAYCNRSFFALICFSLSTSLSVFSPPSLALLFPPLNEDALLASSPLEDKRPSRSSHRAMRACSRRSRRSRCNSHRARREFISGVRDARRSRWADRMEDSGRSSKCFDTGC